VASACNRLLILTAEQGQGRSSRTDSLKPKAQDKVTGKEEFPRKDLPKDVSHPAEKHCPSSSFCVHPSTRLNQTLSSL